MMDDFWQVIADQLGEMASAKNADDVTRILSPDRNPYGPGTSSAPGFFAGGDGDDLRDVLCAAGWDCTWWKASYHYKMRASDGSVIEYVEGDIYATEPTTGRADGKRYEVLWGHEEHERMLWIDNGDGTAEANAGRKLTELIRSGVEAGLSVDGQHEAGHNFSAATQEADHE